METIKRFLSLCLINLFPVVVYSCPVCNRSIKIALQQSVVHQNLLIILSVFFILAMIVAVISVVVLKSYSGRVYHNKAGVSHTFSPVAFVLSAVVLGIGLGGFLDGILFHQLLQVHAMLSNKIPNNDYVGKSVNMFWDGLFEAFCWIVTVLGIFLLWKIMRRQAVQNSGVLLLAGFFIGWGLFNLIEGTVNHQIYQLHNVLEYAGNHNPANYLFIAISFVMLVAGWVMAIRNVNRNQSDKVT